MASYLPFLYQTRTIQRLWQPLVRPARLALASVPRSVTVRHAYSQRRRRSDDPSEFSIPFEHDGNPTSDTASTITPAEAEVFKNIFDEIAQGKMPVARKKKDTVSSAGDSLWELPNPSLKAGLHQDRIQSFREKFLQRYPAALRESAQVALGFHEFPANEDGDREIFELSEEERNAQAAEKLKYEAKREKQRKRVEGLMEAAPTDAKLWEILRKEVFSLPQQFGIIEEKPKKARRKTKKAKEAETASQEDPSTTENGLMDQENAISEAMNVSGPLYPHYLSKALALFNSGFSQPSPYVFQILPTLKSLGLQACILGVSTPFYLNLAKIHWARHGDAASALDTLQEINFMGLYADDEVVEFLKTIQDHIHGLTWGRQGEFAMAIVEAPPFDEDLMRRLEGMVLWAKGSARTKAREVSSDGEV